MKQFKLLLFIILIAFGTAYANDISAMQKINLLQALELVNAQNVDLVSGRLNIEIAKSNVNSANRLQNPGIFGFLNIGKAGEGNPQQIGLSQTIEIAKRSARKKLAESEFEMANLAYDQKKFDTDLEVRQAYLNLVAAKSLLKITLEQKELLADVMKKLKITNITDDDESRLEIVQSEIAFNQLIAEINKSRNNVKTARADFNRILNIKNDTNIVYDSVDEFLPRKSNLILLLTPIAKEKTPTFQEIADKTIENRYDIRIAKQEIDIAQKNLISVAKQRIPDLELIGGYAYQSSQTSGDRGYLAGGYIGAGITNLPILYNYSPEIKNAKLQLEQANHKYTSIKIAALNNLKSCYDTFVTAKENLNQYDENIIDRSNELLKIAKKSYELGNSSITTLIMLEESYQDVQVAYVNALADYYKAWINLLKEMQDSNIIQTL